MYEYKYTYFYSYPTISPSFTLLSTSRYKMYDYGLFVGQMSKILHIARRNNRLIRPPIIT